MRSLALTGLLVLTLAGCRLLYFPDVHDIVYHPEEPNSVLQVGQPITVKFDLPVDRPSVEAIFSIQGPAGAAPGRFLWSGRRVTFQPEPALVHGKRYVIRFDGVFEDSEGRDHTVRHRLPFYYLSSSEPPPIVISTSPVGGSTLALADPIQIQFSKQIQPATLVRGFSLTPDTRHTLTWNPDGTQLTITPSDGWKNATAYSLTLSGEITDTLDIPLEETFSVSLLAQDDLARPQLSAVESVTNTPPYAGAGSDLTAGGYVLDYDSVLRLTFTEEMDEETTERAFSVTPAVDGTFYWPAPGVMIFAPEQGYVMGTHYTLVLLQDAEDKAGNQLLAETELSLTPTIPVLSVSSVEVKPGDGGLLTTLSSETPVILTPGPAPNRDYDMIFTFSQTFPSDAEKQEVGNAIVFRPLLSGSFSAPFPIGASWTGDDTLSVTYRNVDASVPPEVNYLLLTFPGGEQGIKNTAGSFLPSDVSQLFQVGP